MREFQRDREKIISAVVKKVIQENPEFAPVRENLNFIFTWRVGDIKYDGLGLPVEASVRKLSNWFRDVLNLDLELIVHQDSWDQMTLKQKERLIYQQLLKIAVDVDVDLTPYRDDDNRVKWSECKPDISFKGFSRDLQKHGLPAILKDALKKLDPYRWEDKEKGGNSHE